MEKIKSVTCKGKKLIQNIKPLWTYEDCSYPVFTDGFILSNPAIFEIEYENDWEFEVPSYEELSKGFLVGREYVTSASGFILYDLEKHYLSNLWFPTQSLAEKSLRYNQAKVKLNSLAEYCNGLFERDEIGWFFFYLYENKLNVIKTICRYDYYGLKFSSDQSAEKFLELIPADLKETFIEMIKEKNLI